MLYGAEVLWLFLFSALLFPPTLGQHGYQLIAKARLAAGRKNLILRILVGRRVYPMNTSWCVLGAPVLGYDAIVDLTQLWFAWPADGGIRWGGNGP
jgi:hypothetical protein